MARTTYTEAMEEEILDIKDKFLVIDTLQDGYFNIYKGLHPFRVAKIEEDYAIYPVYWADENILTNEPYPIIRTIGDDVFFIKKTLNDPYNGPDMTKSDNPNSTTVEHKILDAFNAFVESEFNLGHPNPIHIFIGDGKEIGVEDEEVEFELRDLKGNVIIVEEEDELEPEEE